MSIQTIILDDLEENPIKSMNEFIKDKEVIDIKMNTVVAITGNFYTKYLVIYKEISNKK